MKKRELVSLVFATFIYASYGCQIVDHPLWTAPIATSILDTLPVGDTVISRATTDIEGIIDVRYGQAIRGGPYFELSIEASQLVVRTSAAFARYEDVEIATRVPITVDFSCTGGTTRPGLVLWIDITDTNNNAPEFVPTGSFEFLITPPLPPGFLITGCYNDVITVRDIDLTTYRINFTIEDNPYFEIEYDEEASTAEKEFVGQIRTKTFVRSLDGPLMLSINATDVDDTQGPRQTTTGAVRIVADTEFQLPDQPVFYQTFYLANYTDDRQLQLETISLRQGFDEYVNFTLEGEYYEHFDLRADDNQISLVVLYPLPDEVWSERQIYLIVVAEREFTSRATTTVIVQLPEEIELRFERVSYQGVIENNNLQLQPLVLSQGFEDGGVSANVLGEQSSYFSATVESDLVILTMTPLMGDVIDNSFISLEVVVTNGRSSSTAVVNLENIKEDSNTPVFDQFIYSGSYDSATGLSMEAIRFEQGFDSTVTLNLTGEYANFFQIAEIGEVLTITSSTIPPEMFSLQNILVTLEASKPRTVGANAALHIALPAAIELEFEEPSYRGSVEGGLLRLQTISLRGYEEGVSFYLSGVYSSYFTATNEQEVVTVDLANPLPDTAIEQNSAILLTLTASGLNAISTTTTVLLDIIKEDTTTPVFSQPIYYGTYVAGAIEIEAINLTQGFDGVSFGIDGDHAQYFTIDENAIITLRTPIPEDVIFNEKVFMLNVLADKALTVGANAAVLIRFPSDLTELAIIRFSRHTYIGSLEENEFNLEEIVLDTEFVPGTELIISGVYSEHFSWTNTNNIVQISYLNTLPDEVLEENDFIVLELEARRPRAVSVWTSILVDIVKPEIIAPVFGQAYYTGFYTEHASLTFEETINLSEGYDQTVTFALDGTPEAWFSLEQEGESLTLVSHTPVPPDVLESNNQLLFTIIANKPNTATGRAVISLHLPKENNQQLVFVVTAQSPGNATARATIVITLVDSSSGSQVLGFEHVSYLGSIENNHVNIPPIILREGFTQDVEFSLHGELENYFSLVPEGPVVTVTLQEVIPETLIPANRIIVLEIQASALEAASAYATIVIHCIVDEDIRPVVELIFAQTFYNGSYAVATGLTFPTAISLTQGYDSDVEFGLEGDDATWFGLAPDEDSVTVTLISPIPTAVIENNEQLVFVVTAQSPGSATARTVVIINLQDDSQSGSDVTFEKVVNEGFVRNGVVYHEIITVIGFSGSTIELRGDYSSMFDATLSDEKVTVSASGLTLPSDVTYVILELGAGTASAVLVLSVEQTDGPSTPTVTFASPSYAVRVDISHTGVMGQVQASADNGEAVTYSLQLDNEYLEQRLSINGEGELRLSAPLNSGFYTFEVIATTVFTRVQGTATVHLSVEAVTVCGDELVMPPLIVLDVDEEEPHNDLINGTGYNDCHFTLNNRWPLNQTWVYVDERGLHTTPIDREHDSIAFMALSQVQVEVILHCEQDATRLKRSLADPLGPYDYGSNKWILTDTILYNSRRSMVNIIVNDINDNSPIFVGKENEPIAVGYPIPELAERVLPRSLAELQATDADIGDNAALLYWSSAPELAVSTTTGFVHLRAGAALENGARLTVSATDRNGEGLTGSIDILVRLLDESYVAVVTVRDAFLDDEETVVAALSEAIGYEVKVLRATVISREVETEDSRKKRDVTSAEGASLQLYVYGLIAREPVSVDQLTMDISNIVTAPVIIASSVSLQDHLEGQEICDMTGRDTGLLVATIILSVLLFIVLVLIAVWFFLRWRKNINYDEFSDENILTSRKSSMDTFPKAEIVSKPRLDAVELKKSERRLQEMLDAPIQEISVEPTSSSNDAIFDMPEEMAPSSRNTVNFKLPEPIAPLVIQSIDKLKDAADDSSDDEFGEVKTPRRKSVVTFNENVEKIIHVEDTPDIEDPNAEPDYEVHKL